MVDFWNAGVPTLDYGNNIRQVAKEGGNMFECIMDIVEHCTLGQITEVLFETQGRFRRDL